MTPPRFQFTINGVLWATFWVAVCAGAWIYKPDPLEGNPVVIFLATATRFVGPIIAIGALFGRTRQGAMVGAAVATVGLVLYWLGGWLQDLFFWWIGAH